MIHKLAHLLGINKKETLGVTYKDNLLLGERCLKCGKIENVNEVNTGY